MPRAVAGSQRGSSRAPAWSCCPFLQCPATAPPLIRLQCQRHSVLPCVALKMTKTAMNAGYTAPVPTAGHVTS